MNALFDRVSRPHPPFPSRTGTRSARRRDQGPAFYPGSFFIYIEGKIYIYIFIHLQIVSAGEQAGEATTPYYYHICVVYMSTFFFFPRGGICCNRAVNSELDFGGAGTGRGAVTHACTCGFSPIVLGFSFFFLQFVFLHMMFSPFFFFFCGFLSVVPPLNLSLSHFFFFHNRNYNYNYNFTSHTYTYIHIHYALLWNSPASVHNSHYCYSTVLSLNKLFFFLFSLFLVSWRDGIV